MPAVEKKKKTKVVKPELCTGCRVCQLECSFRHHKVFNPALAHITVLETPKNGISYAISYKDDCLDCLACVQACVFGALTAEEGGE